MTAGNTLPNVIHHMPYDTHCNSRGYSNIEICDTEEAEALVDWWLVQLLLMHLSASLHSTHFSKSLNPYTAYSTRYYPCLAVVACLFRVQSLDSLSGNHLIGRPREVSETQALGLNCSGRSEIWQAPRQQRGAFQISERCDHYSIQSRGFKSTRALAVRRLI